MVTLTERLPKFGLIFVIPGKESSHIRNLFTKLKGIFYDKFKEVFKSVRCDNGSEFTERGEILNGLGSKGYYTHPYSAYEKETNERMNGLIRRFIPKGKKISETAQGGIKKSAGLV